MFTKPEIVIDGLKIKSPCAECIFHIQAIPKNNCEACKVCTARVEYDEVVSIQWAVVPWISSADFKKLALMKLKQKENNRMAVFS